MLRFSNYLRIAGLVACAMQPPLAAAKGTATVHWSNGTQRIYEHVTIRVLGTRATPATSKTIVVSQNHCARVGSLERCQPYWTNLIHSGVQQRLDLLRGFEYVNLGRVTTSLPHSAYKLAANGLMLTFSTRHGVTITITGQVDRYYR
jgi:hypothetical protein